MGDGAATGTAFSRAGEKLLQLDLTDSDALHAALQQVKPELVIHCAPERWPDRCAAEPDSAWQLNVDSSERLVQLCRDAGAQLIYISTDYVFDSSAAPYCADDAPNPINFYGRSKLAGEKAVLANGSHWVLRLPLLFGPVTHLHESGVTGLLDTLRHAEPTALDDWAVRFPTSTEEVAAVLEQCVAKICDGEQFHGIYQWSGDTACTRYQLAGKVAEACGLSAAHISADLLPDYTEPRPYNCQLDKSRLTDRGITAGEPLAEQLARYLEPFL